MPRGGKRQGTPGAAYADRTDLMQDYDMSKNTAATGGMTAPAPAPQPPPQLQMRHPEDTPGLTAPTEFPDEDILTGLGSIPPPRVTLADTLAALAPYDTSGTLTEMLDRARRRGW